MKKIFANIFIFTIKIYKYFISPILGGRCRFLPSCSEYCISSIETFGVFKGCILSVKRILKCHPFKFLGGGSGLDLVPKKEDK